MSQQQAFDELYKDNATRRQRGGGWSFTPSRWLQAAVELVEETSANKTALVIGCGDGRNAKYLQDKGYHVVAVDYSQHAIALTKTALEKETDVYNKDMTKPNAIACLGQYDLVTDVSVMDHITRKDLPVYLDNLKQAIKPQGHLFTMQFDETLSGIHNQERDKEEKGIYFRAYTVDELEKILIPLKPIATYEHVQDEDDPSRLYFHAMLLQKH